MTTLPEDDWKVDTLNLKKPSPKLEKKNLDRKNTIESLKSNDSRKKVAAAAVKNKEMSKAERDLLVN